MTDEAPKRRPFHETIVDAIKKGHGPRLSTPLLLSNLIKDTDIPKNHDRIIAVWEEVWGEDLYGIVADLLEQKKEAEEKMAKKAAEQAKREDSMAARIGRYLLASVDMTDEVVDQIWNALPGEARVALQTEAVAEVVSRRERARAKQ